MPNPLNANTAFDTAYARTEQFEGGYANNSLDNGGETYKGIARNFNPGWEGWSKIDAIKARFGTNGINTRLSADSELQEDIKAFYKQNYWDVNRLSALTNTELASKLFDIGVNMGVGTAAKMLQEALNLTNRNGRAYLDTAVDGKVGPETVRLTNQHPNPKLLLKIINALQAERYIRIMRNTPSQEAFAESWFSRVTI